MTGIRGSSPPSARARPAPALAADGLRRLRHLIVLLLTIALASLAVACDGESAGPERVVTIDPETGEPQEGDGGGEQVESLVDSDCENRDLRPEDDNLTTVERATLCLANAERQARDRPALENDPQLAEAAERKARDMVTGEYFAHEGPDGRDVVDWARDSGYITGQAGYRVGENLGWASGRGATPERIVLGWMRSPGHRRNMLNERFRDSGIGVVLGAPREEGGGGATYTHMLGFKP